MSGFGPTVLRLVVGAVFLSHGVMKVSPAFGGLPETTAMLASLDFKVPHLVAAALGAIELGGGIALMLGAYTGWTAIALLLTTGVTSWKLHLPNGLFLNWSREPGVGNGVEFDLVLVGALLCLVATGGGWPRWKRPAGRAGAAIAETKSPRFPVEVTVWTALVPRSQPAWVSTVPLAWSVRCRPVAGVRG